MQKPVIHWAGIRDDEKDGFVFRLVEQTADSLRLIDLNGCEGMQSRSTLQQFLTTHVFHSFRCFTEELSEGDQGRLWGECGDGFRLKRKRKEEEETVKIIKEKQRTRHKTVKEESQRCKWKKLVQGACGNRGEDKWNNKCAFFLPPLDLHMYWQCTLKPSGNQ